MCGIVGAISKTPVNQLLYDGLLLVQHRGQDAAGIVTSDGQRLPHAQGSRPGARRVPHPRHARRCRAPSASRTAATRPRARRSPAGEAQPFYVNSPFGIVLGHNGNLTNAEQLKQEMFRTDLRHINTNSDSEVLLNVLAHELEQAARGPRLDPETIFSAVSSVHRRCRGAYAVVAMIAGYGLLAFRDPFGIRPLVIGRNDTDTGPEWVVASESVVLDSLGFTPGARRRARRGDPRSTRRATSSAGSAPRRRSLTPCIFEYVYLARPDSLIDGVSVYEARLRMGEQLADKIGRQYRNLDIDVVIPVPDTSRPSALQLATRLGVTYREGFVKNRYVGRTFIMPGQTIRKKSVRQKLNAIALEFKDKNVLIVDDSIVRGTTSREIVQMARESGANKVFFASARRRRCASRTSTASTCRRAPS